MDKYHITLCSNSTPIVNPPRQILCSLKEHFRQATEANVNLGILIKVDEPTDWVHNLVIVEKRMAHFICVWIHDTLIRQLSMNTIGFKLFKKLQVILMERQYLQPWISKMDTGR